MKLRNKKTGEIKECYSVAIFENALGDGAGEYHTIEELNEEWEDYKSVEPLIKDEKIRKAVRAWAEANDIDGATFYTSSHFWYLRTFNDRGLGIDFWLKWEDKPNLIEAKDYTIAELCGEEEKNARDRV